jgi:nucleotidyltransferase substrate binding protein (TIGR01987 family)
LKKELIMSELNIEALRLAVNAVDSALDDYQYAEATKSRLLLSVRDGAIQRFEVALDLARKMILRVLKEKFGLDDVAANNKTFIREAAKYGLIADVEGWLNHLESRNQSSHTYDAPIAEEVFADIPNFLSNARDLIKRLDHALA